MRRALPRIAWGILAAAVVISSNPAAAGTGSRLRRDAVIVFAGVSPSVFGLFVINPDGSGKKRLIGGADSFPVWSPDGKRIAFSRERGKRHELEVMNADGTGMRTVITTGAESSVGGLVASWSPDGRRLAFCSERSGTLAIYLIAVAGHGLRKLTHDKGGSCEPDWSPDGKSIVFGTVRSGTGQEIYVMRADGGNQHSLTKNLSGNDFSPDWSPDGHKIVFVSDRASKEDIFVMNSDGSRQRRLTHIRADAPAWSPDGKRIVLASERSGNWQLWLINADGTGQRQLTRGRGVFATNPSWQPLH
jgi:Tol biopolymer transport system component